MLEQRADPPRIGRQMFADLSGTSAARLASAGSPGCQQEARALSILDIRDRRIVHHTRQLTSDLLGQVMTRLGAGYGVSPAPDLGDPHLDQPQHGVTLPRRCHRQQCRYLERTSGLGNLANLDGPTPAHPPRVGA